MQVRPLRCGSHMQVRRARGAGLPGKCLDHRYCVMYIMQSSKGCVRLRNVLECIRATVFATPLLPQGDFPAPPK